MNAAQLRGIRALEELLEDHELVHEREVLTPSGIKRRKRVLRGRALVQHCLDICAFHASLLRPGAFQPEAEVRGQLKALADAIDALGPDAELFMQSIENGDSMTDLERHARGFALHYVREHAARTYYTDVRGVRRIARAQFGRDVVELAGQLGIAVDSSRSAEFVEFVDALCAVMDVRVDGHRLARDIVAGADDDE